MDEIKLLPCPFCNGEATYEKGTVEGTCPGQFYELVRCKDCDAEIYEDNEDVFYEAGDNGIFSVVEEKWNQRAK